MAKVHKTLPHRLKDAIDTLHHLPVTLQQSSFADKLRELASIPQHEGHNIETETEGTQLHHSPVDQQNAQEEIEAIREILEYAKNNDQIDEQQVSALLRRYFENK